MARKKKENNKPQKKKTFPSPADGEVTKEQWEKWNMEYFGESNFYDSSYSEDDDDETKELDFNH